MSIFHVLYQSYLKAEEYGYVDAPELDDTGKNITLLPLYHTNLRSNGDNIIQIVLDDDGNPAHLEFIEKDVYTVFPITEDSLNRTSNAFAHPICDDMQYLSKSLNEKKYADYCIQNETWTNEITPLIEEQENETASDLITFLKQVRSLVLSKDLVDVAKDLIRKKHLILNQDQTSIEVVLEAEGPNKKAVTKKYDLSKVFVTFAKQFSDAYKKDLDISKNQLLHQAHIQYVHQTQSEQKKSFATCNISGKYMYCTERNRGLLGKGKLISVSNRTETYQGRFRQGSEITHIGADTSECIHLMLKFFLEHRDNAQGLYNNTTAVVWFSEDLLNERQFSLTDPLKETSNFWSDEEDEYQSKSTSDEKAQDWKKILRGERRLSPEEEDDFFYLAMINKISNGRVAIQSTRTIPLNSLIDNLLHWQESCHWEMWSAQAGTFQTYTPRSWEIVRFVYGIEKDDGRVDCLKDELRSLAFKRLMPCIIDGFPLPKDMARQIFSNYKNRIGFRKNWRFLQYMACALLNKAKYDQGKEKRSPMLEKDKQTRDYLYGRLLAVYEKIETDAMMPAMGSNEKGNVDKSGGHRVTNVEKIWAAFFQAPERMLETLHSKIRPYLNKLKANQPGKYTFYNRLLGEIQTDIRDAESYLSNKNKALNEDAVFGYYAQNKDFYTPRKEKKENEDA